MARSAHREFFLPSLHIFGLWALAVAQPLFDLLGQSPEFFVAHDITSAEILLVVLGLVLVLPALLITVIWPASPKRQRGVIAALASVLAMQIVKQTGIQTAVIAAPMAVTAGIAAGVAYHRLAAVRTFVTLLSLAVVIVPAIFLTRPGIRRSIVPPQERRSPEVRLRPGVARPGPVLMVVMDETPLVSLLDGEGKIDPVLYPNLARLARDGIWFRNATVVSDYTRWALPAIVSGKYPRAHLLPTRADHPETLFTLLGRTHRLEVVETVTRLCPADLCRPVPEPLRARLATVGSDLFLLYLHLLLPDDLRNRLPELTADWARSGAAGAGRKQRAPRAARTPRRDNYQIALQFADWIARDDPQPTFYFFHTLLPHSPWQWLPSGQRNATRRPVPGDAKWSWTDEAWGIAQYYQRHLLQIGLVDSVVGRLIARLEAEGLYDRTLVVVTADHGVAFRPSAPRRNFSEETAAEIMRVPLIIKLPAGAAAASPTTVIAGQRISDRNAETVDIAPTVIDALGIESPWKADGTSLLDASRRERESKQMFFDSARRQRSYGRDGPDAALALRRKLDIFGGSDNFYRVPRPPRFGELVGRPLGELRIEDGGGSVSVDFLSAFENIHTRTDAVPFDVGGQFQPPRSNGAPMFVAVAVNGIVRAVTRTWSSEPHRWLATPPLDAWRDGRNDLKVFIVDTDVHGPLLRRTIQLESPRDRPR